MSNQSFFRPAIESQKVTNLSEGEFPTAAKIPVWFFRVKIDVDSKGNVSFGYDHAAKKHVSSQTDFDSLIDEAAKFSRPTWGRVLGKNGATPFSIDCVEKCFFVLVLDSNENWEFSSTRAPFEIETGHEQFYFNATRVDPNGNSVVGDGELPGAKLAYFYGECDLDRKKHGGGAFQTAFNIYFDLLLYWKGHTHRLPLTVDPDVGHPGGATPP